MVNKDSQGRSFKINIFFVIVIVILLLVISNYYQFPAVDFVLFWIYVVLFAVIPGVAILHVLKIKGLTTLERIVVANTVGLCCLTYFSWLFSAKFALPYYSYIPIIGLSWLYFLYKLTKKGMTHNYLTKVKSIEFTACLIIVLLSVVSTLGFMANFTLDGSSYKFFQPGEEGIWHIGNIAYVKNSLDFHDIHQGGVKLVYHHFTYIFLAFVSNIFRIETAIIFFKFMPLYIMLFIGVGAYSLFKRMMQNTIVALLGVVIVFFLDNASIFSRFVLRLLGITGLTSNGVWDVLDVHPHLTYLQSSCTLGFSTLILLSLFPLVSQIDLNSRRHKFNNLMLIGLIIGSLIGFKTPVFIIVACSIILMFIFEWLRYRTFNFFLIGSAALLVSFPFILDILLKGHTITGFHFAYPIRVQNNNAIGHFESLFGSWGLLAYLPAFFLLSWGPRVFAFKFFINDWKLQNSPNIIYLFLWAIAIFGFIVSLTCVSPPKMTDLGNYSYFLTTISLSILCVRFVYDLWQRGYWIKLSCVSAFFLIFLTGLASYSGIAQRLVFAIETDRVTALRHLRELTADRRVLLLGRRYEYDGAALPQSKGIKFYEYSAFSEQMVLSEATGFSAIKFENPELLNEIREDTEVFFTSQDVDKGQQILMKWKIDYVITEPALKNADFTGRKYLTPVWQSPDLIIYQFLKSNDTGKAQSNSQIGLMTILQRFPKSRNAK